LTLSDGATALQAASANGDVLAIEALVKAGADVNQVDGYGDE
jgi:ankyrin repeat protein